MTTTDLAQRAAAAATPDLFEPADPALTLHQHIGFELGWDHAHHGITPPAPYAHEPSPIRSGWLAGTATQLRPGDMLLFVGPEFEADADSNRWDARVLTQVQADAIEVVAYRLRKKLAATAARLVTLRGLGYLLKAEA